MAKPKKLYIPKLTKSGKHDKRTGAFRTSAQRSASNRRKKA